jgi:ribosomal protein S18 acetylase RimI-like enzyme
MNIRTLHASDASHFLRLRLFGLLEAPSAFGSSYQEEKDRTIEQVQGHLVGSSETLFIGGFQECELLGVVGVGREQRAKQRHMAFIRSMYVAPHARGQGFGRRLLSAALVQVSSWHGIERVKLSVTASNQPAVHLYQSAGFVEVGLVPRALRLGNDYFDELIMVRVMS